jgi:hypothetical protein
MRGANPPSEPSAANDQVSNRNKLSCRDCRRHQNDRPRQSKVAFGSENACRRQFFRRSATKLKSKLSMTPSDEALVSSQGKWFEGGTANSGPESGRTSDRSKNKLLS